MERAGRRLSEASLDSSDGDEALADLSPIFHPAGHARWDRIPEIFLSSTHPAGSVASGVCRLSTPPSCPSSLQAIRVCQP